jgi:tetrahydromethanopterin S-methyltransferase subunit C
MSERSSGWEAIARLADVLGIMAVLVSAGVAIAHAFGVTIGPDSQALLTFGVGCSIAGVFLLISGLVRAADPLTAFDADRGRKARTFELVGGVLIVLGLASIPLTRL